MFFIRRRRTVTCGEQQNFSSPSAGVLCSIELVISLSQVLSTLCIECANWQSEVWAQIVEVCVVECGAEWRGMVASRGKRSRCVGTSLPSTTRIHSHTLTLGFCKHRWSGPKYRYCCNEWYLSGFHQTKKISHSGTITMIMISPGKEMVPADHIVENYLSF